ncbi:MULTISPECIES: ATP-binding protein [unclassified Exiguobacterium]|uniref:ATP-binding protein n=1 Tax=unclassified Exiguobacterium TaxID=2644629 RepID=UPI001BEA8DEA|nr:MULTISPECIES: ATP-binding protein [unclassified Exiguobacterium]
MNEIVKPNLSNFIKSLRDFGYNFQIALADIIDNSIAAESKNILIETESDPSTKLSVLDDGFGMTEEELIEAMRLGSKDPEDQREKKDLGRFGLGLKTASFSQCKRLTVISKKNGGIYSRRWDLELIIEKNEWLLITPDFNEFENDTLFKKLTAQKSGTLVIWEKIDTIHKNEYPEEIILLRSHLALVFHRFLEGNIKGRKFFMSLNNNEIKGFNPFNENNLATQTLPDQIIKVNNKRIKITPYILPHHSKLSNLEYDKYATNDGYTKSQGFYLYRGGRLLIHGTWWGLNKISDAHRLIRIRVDISNDQDSIWNIDVKKSIAYPNSLIKNELKKVLNNILNRGQNVYSRRPQILEDKSVFPFWNVTHTDGAVKFKLNQNHPILDYLKKTIKKEEDFVLNTYLKGVEAYIPITAIEAYVITEPKKINQKDLIKEHEKKELLNSLLSLDLTKEQIESLLKTELFKELREE